MNTFFRFNVLFLIFLLIGCGSESYGDKFNVNNPYWDIEDYKLAYRNIKYNVEDLRKPSYQDSEAARVFSKIIDLNNLSAVFEDEALGDRYKSELASEFFSTYIKIESLYYEQNREDKYIYPLELIELNKFGLYLQVHYFHLGNQNIINNADNPESRRIVELIKSNEQTLMGNFNNYLDFVKKEDAFTEEAISSYIDGIDHYFPLLIDMFPDANYRKIRRKTKNMLEKTQRDDIKKSLEKLLVVIDK